MSENTKPCQEPKPCQDPKKHYKLFRVTNSFPNGDLISDYIGDAIGHMESGATVTSNTPRGPGYLVGVLKAQRSAPFTLTENKILTLPEGDSLLEQTEIGSQGFDEAPGSRSTEVQNPDATILREINFNLPVYNKTFF